LKTIIVCSNRFPYQSKRIDEFNRIVHNIGIGIQPTPKPNRITGDVPSYARVIVPEVVVIQPRLPIRILPRKPQVHHRGTAIAVRVFIRPDGAEGVRLPAPDDRARAVGGYARGAEVVGVQVGQCPGAVLGVVHLGHRPSFKVKIVPNGRAVQLRFGKQAALQIIVVQNGSCRRLLAHALAEGVVGVGGDKVPVFVYAVQSACGVVFEGAGAISFYGEIAGPVSFPGFPVNGDQAVAVAVGLQACLLFHMVFRGIILCIPGQEFPDFTAFHPGYACYAKKVTQDIAAKTDILDELPRMGKVVPELDNEAIRELSLYSYRILYEIREPDVVVLAVIHKRRDLQPEMVER